MKASVFLMTAVIVTACSRSGRDLKSASAAGSAGAASSVNVPKPGIKTAPATASTPNTNAGKGSGSTVNEPESLAVALPPALDDIGAGWAGRPGRTSGTVDVRLQTPRLSSGARIIMFANVLGYYNAHKWYAPDANKRIMWESYNIAPQGNAPALGNDPNHYVMYIHNQLVNGGSDPRVLEDWDWLNGGAHTLDMTCAGGVPYNHGSWNTPILQTGWSQVGPSIGSYDGGTCTTAAPYNIQIQRQMDDFPTHIGTMQGVTLTVEDQGPGFRYIFYWANNYGVIGVQGLTDDFARTGPLLQAWKTCDVDSTVFVCP